MDLAALRRAFRARPGTAGCSEFAAFLDGLGTHEAAWQTLVSLLDKDVIPVVSRCHPAVEADDIASTCLAATFETWVAEWLDCVHGAELVRKLLDLGRDDEAFDELQKHPQYRGPRATRAEALFRSKKPREALCAVEGTRSARGYFIARTRAKIGEAERKQRRQSLLLTRSGLDKLGLPQSGSGSGTRLSLATRVTRSLCGAELDCDSGEGNTWCISALPPAQLLSQELNDRVRRMLAAIEDLGPEHSRVFKLLLEGLSQRSIAKVEGRHPAAISRRVQSLRELCRVQLLG